MYVAVNTIRVKKGHGTKLIERFKTPKGLHKMPGFMRFELWQTVNEQDEAEEFQVCTMWESEEAFLNWVNSEAFRRAHENANKDNSYIIDSKFSKHTIAIRYTIDDVQEQNY